MCYIFIVTCDINEYPSHKSMRLMCVLNHKNINNIEWYYMVMLFYVNSIKIIINHLSSLLYPMNSDGGKIIISKDTGVVRVPKDDLRQNSLATSMAGNFPLHFLRRIQIFTSRDFALFIPRLRANAVTQSKHRWCGK